MLKDYNTVAIIQARMGSTRLPGKVLFDLGGKTVLERVIERVNKSKLIDRVIVATTIKSEDNAINDICKNNNVLVYRGSEHDVLERYYHSATQFHAEHIIRITADCPLIDPQIINQVIILYHRSKADYASNILIETFPDGLDVEIFSYNTLKKAYTNAQLPSEREHVTSYIRNHPELFSLKNLTHTPDFSKYRLTLDEEKDYILLQEIYRELTKTKRFFYMNDIISLLKNKPELLKINVNIIRNEGYKKSIARDKMQKKITSPTTLELYNKAKKIIPGGTQLLSKRPEMFLPDMWPAYYSKSKGCEVWDLDGNKYIDMCYMGIGANILGYANPSVDMPVKKAITAGNMTTLNAPEEYDLATLLLKLHPWADMVRYARSGGEAMAISVRIARAATKKDTVLFCGYHGWHDWYLSANLATDRALDGHLLPGLEPNGVPRGLIGTAIPFQYNNMGDFSKKFNKHKHELAAVVMEPLRNEYPNKGFLETIRKLTQENKIILVFDEITSGFRLAVGGAHMKLKHIPDIAVFAKGMSNGYPMAAIIGKKKVMEHVQDTFISSTYWTDRIGPTAALATIETIGKKKVIPHINAIGKKVQEGWLQLKKKYKLNMEISGIYPLGHFSFDYPNGQAIKTLMIQYMLAHGYLTSTVFYASYAHTEKVVTQYLTVLDTCFAYLKKAIDTKSVEKQLTGPIAQSGFKRLT